MFLPIGDEPNLRGRPWLNYALIAANALVWFVVAWPLSRRGVDVEDPVLRDYLRVMVAETGLPVRQILAQTSAYDLFVFVHGFKPAAPQLADLFASMFLHGGWLHLIGNMLFLWIYGDNVELYLGRLGYLILYLATGVAATAGHAVFSLNSLVPMVGASGAISGVLGCYFLWFPRNQVRVLLLFGFYMNVVMLPARWVLGAYLVLDNLLPLLLIKSSTGVAHGAHIGGFVGGLAGAFVISRVRDLRKLRAAAHERPHAKGGEVDFPGLVARGDWGAALERYVDMSARERAGLRDDDVVTLSDRMTEAGELEAALALLQRFIATHPHSPALARAHLRAALIHLRLERNPAAYQHFLAVLDLEATSEEAAAARSGLAEVERRERARQRFRPRTL